MREYQKSHSKYLDFTRKEMGSKKTEMILMSRKSRILNLLNPITLFVIASSLLATFFWTKFLISQKYLIDEAQYPYAAEAVATTGVPIFYKSELEPTSIGIWHSPFYTYTLGYWIKLIGNSATTVRLYGVFCLVVSCALIFIILKKLDSPRVRNYPSAVGVVFYLTHYLVLQNSLIPDIDGTILPVAILCTAYVCVKIHRKELGKVAEMILVSLALGFGFSAKLTTPLIFVPFLFFVLVIAGNGLLRSFAKTCVCSILGFVFFLAWWYPLARSSGLDWLYPFKFTFQSVTSKNSNHSISEIIIRGFEMSPNVILWIGIPTLLLSMSLIFFIRKITNKNDKHLAIALIALSFTIWFIYNVITGAPFGFAKYWNTPIALFAIVIGYIITKIELTTSGHEKLLISLIFIFGLGVLSLDLHRRLQYFNDLEAMFSVKILIFLVILIVLFAFTLNKISQNNVPAGIFLALLLGTLTYNMSANNALAHYEKSTRYYFGENGINETCDWILENVPLNQSIFAPKDVGLQVNRTYFEDALLLNGLGPTALKEYLIDQEVQYVVVRKKFDYSPIVFGPTFQEIRLYFSKTVFTFGDFEIWERSKSARSQR